jgi:hypothetical protein
MDLRVPTLVLEEGARASPFFLAQGGTTAGEGGKESLPRTTDRWMDFRHEATVGKRKQRLFFSCANYKSGFCLCQNRVLSFTLDAAGRSL